MLQEFKKALAEMHLSESDTHRLFRAFDSDCSGYLSYDEFLVGLRGQLSARRLDMVQRAFKVGVRSQVPMCVREASCSTKLISNYAAVLVLCDVW